MSWLPRKIPNTETKAGASAQHNSDRTICVAASVIGLGLGRSAAAAADSTSEEAVPEKGSELHEGGGHESRQQQQHQHHCVPGFKPLAPLRARQPPFTSHPMNRTAFGRKPHIVLEAPRSPVADLWNRSPGQALVEQMRQEQIARDEVAMCIEALYKQRKATLRLLRRCEDMSDLDALRRLLDPQPHRTALSNGCVRARPHGLSSCCSADPLGLVRPLSLHCSKVTERDRPSTCMTLHE